MKKLIAIVGALVIASTVAQAADKYPTRDITNVVVWSAGGGTDVCNRIVSAEMGQFLGVNVNVTNKPGGVAGSIGMSYVYSKPAG